MKKKDSSKNLNKSNQRLGNILILLMIVLFVVGAFAVYKLLTLPPEQRTLEQKEVSGASFRPTVPNKYQPAGEAPDGMAWIPGGEFSMGCEDPRGFEHGGHDPMYDTRPIHRVYVDGFWMDKTEVTNERFEEFVKATGYITVAEKTLLAEDFPGAPPENLVAGSVVFTPPGHSVPLDNHYRWWDYIHGANWRHPLGPDSDLSGKENYPVVHVAYEDAVSYCKWVGKRLPTEAEWEFAARGGLSGKLYAWGDELKPGGKWMANTYQGSFPNQEAQEDGFGGIAPVAQFPPNDYGLYDMSGNVWEWVSDWYRPDYYVQLAAAGDVAINPQGSDSSFDPAEQNEQKRVHRGGSFLCTEEYCTRYMVGTRGKGEVSTGSNHLSFRCVMTDEQWKAKGATE
jgi:formylglycine-generating enzyme required for sulfatase activity